MTGRTGSDLSAHDQSAEGRIHFKGNQGSPDRRLIFESLRSRMILPRMKLAWQEAIGIDALGLLERNIIAPHTVRFSSLRWTWNQRVRQVLATELASFKASPAMAPPCCLR